MHYLRTFFISAALHPEVGVDEKEGFCGKVFKLQIPSGMIGCYVAYHRHVKSVKADIRIIVVEIRYSSFLALFATVFAYIVTEGRPRNQSQIYGNIKRLQLPCSVHGNIVNAADMPQSVKSSQLRSKAHELVYIIPCNDFSQPEILPVAALAFDFIGTYKMNIHRRVKSRGVFLTVENRLQKLQQKQAFP